MAKREQNNDCSRPAKHRAKGRAAGAKGSDLDRSDCNDDEASSNSEKPGARRRSRSRSHSPAANEDLSVYESTFQEIDTAQHPMLRVAKLTRRLREDKNLSNAGRRNIKARRNIITFRIKQNRAKEEAEFMAKALPQLQSMVSAPLLPFAPDRPAH